tara:strand:- start:304 stop:627 length:324 start_codon:yes stop_codon:yes gene_type:complete
LSFSSDTKKYINPIRFYGLLNSAKEKLKLAIHKAGNAKFVSETRLYWHIEYTSFLWGFIDDVEIKFDESKSIIHIRSSSRVGYWDLGVNRKRVEEIRLQFKNLNKMK